MPSGARESLPLTTPKGRGPVVPDLGPESQRWLGIEDAASLAHLVLSINTLCRLATWRGQVIHRLNLAHAEALRANLEPFAPPGESGGSLARQFLAGQQIRRLLLAIAPRLTTPELRALVPIRGLEWLEQHRAEGTGRGAILLVSHVHSVGGLLAVTLLRRIGYDVRVALPPAGDAWAVTRAGRMIDGLLGQKPTITEALGGFTCQFNVRPIVRHLEAGTIVAQTGDGWHSAGFVDAQFLGRTLPFPTGVLSVARLTGVPVLPLFAAGPARRMEFEIEAPFHVGRGDGELEEAVQRYAARLDRQVRAWPAAWEHWAIPNTLDTLAGWRDRPLHERYAV